ncbi:MAG: hypothetical protein KDI11_04430, partial [Alphaproteobacteria bacterium]|nr:hypothetical protein [Alphaproteobacteria bacterium]
SRDPRPYPARITRANQGFTNKKPYKVWGCDSLKLNKIHHDFPFKKRFLIPISNFINLWTSCG